MERESKILWMPAYKSYNTRDIINWYAKHETNGDRKLASNRFFKDKQAYAENPGTSRIQFDKLSNSWRGRKAFLPREKFGLEREGSDPNNLRNVLKRGIGDGYASTEEIEQILAVAYGAENAASKFMMARQSSRHLLKYKQGVWYLWTTPDPTREQIIEYAGESRWLADIQKYGDMPGCFNKPDRYWDPEKSEVNAYIMKVNECDLETAEKERKRINKHGTTPEHEKAVHIYDPDSRMTYGSNIWHREASPAAKANLEAARKAQEIADAKARETAEREERIKKQREEKARLEAAERADKPGIHWWPRKSEVTAENFWNVMTLDRLFGNSSEGSKLDTYKDFLDYAKQFYGTELTREFDSDWLIDQMISDKVLVECWRGGKQVWKLKTPVESTVD